MPKILQTLEVFRTVPSLDLRIDIRGQEKPDATGKVGDGIIGAQAIEFNLPLVTNDRELSRIVVNRGGTVRARK